MRTAIISFLCIIFLVFSIFGIYTISNNIIRKNELHHNTNNALEQAMINLKEDKLYPISTTDGGKEFIGDFVQRLLYLTNSDSTITINILAVDVEKGLLDVEVTATYNTIFHNRKQIHCRRTILYDEETSTSKGA